MGDPIDFRPGGLRLTIGRPAVVRLPPESWRGLLTGLHFESDKCFLLPGAVDGMRAVRHFFDEHPGASVLVVGHTDAAGAFEYNRVLSVERARSVAAFLIDDVDAWLEWYAGRPGSQRWGAREDHLMLGALGFDGVRAFQTAYGLAIDGIAGPQTRRALVNAYLTQDGTSLPPGTQVEAHGCGENHPEVPTADGVADARNRRLDVFFFTGQSEPRPAAACSPPGCAEYAVWRDQVVETFDLAHAHAPPPLPPIGLAAFLPGAARAGVSLVARDDSGNEVQRLAAAQAGAGPGDFVTFDLAALLPLHQLVLALERDGGVAVASPLQADLASAGEALCTGDFRTLQVLLALAGAVSPVAPPIPPPDPVPDDPGDYPAWSELPD